MYKRQVQWDDSPNAGFTTGTPWIEVNPNYTAINAAAEEDVYKGQPYYMEVLPSNNPSIYYTEHMAVINGEMTQMCIRDSCTSSRTCSVRK